jgi:hypothetical protein
MATMTTTTTTTAVDPSIAPPLFHTIDQHQLFKNIKPQQQQQQNQHGYGDNDNDTIDDDEADTTDTDETDDVCSSSTPTSSRQQQQYQPQLKTQTQIKIKVDDNNNNNNNNTCDRRLSFTRSASARSCGTRTLTKQSPMTESGRLALKTKLVMLTTNDTNNSGVNENEDKDDNIIDDYHSTSLKSLYFSLSSSCSKLLIGKQQQQKQILLPLDVTARPPFFDSNHATDKSISLNISDDIHYGNTKTAGETVAVAAAAGKPNSNDTISEKNNKASSSPITTATATPISNNNSNSNKKPLALPSKKMVMTSESMHPQAGSLTGSDSDDESYIEESSDDDDDDDELSCFSLEFVNDFFAEEGGDDQVLGVVVEEEQQQQQQLYQTNNTNRKVVVRFDEYDETQMTLHINDFSQQEIQNVWYKCEDYDDMIRNSRIVALKDEHRRRHHHHRQHHQHHQSELETRGLESWSILGMKRAHTKKENAFSAVWEEQNRQWDDNYINFDFDKIRIAYCTVSQSSQKEANERGISDEKIAIRLRELDELRTSSHIIEKRRRSLNTVTGHHRADYSGSASSSAIIAASDHQSLLESIQNINVEELALRSSTRILRARRRENRLAHQQRYQDHHQQHYQWGYASWESGLVSGGKV